MEITLTKELEALVEDQVRSGRYLDASDVIREALRVWELREQYESPELEALLLETVDQPSEPYGPWILDEIRQSVSGPK